MKKNILASLLLIYSLSVIANFDNDVDSLKIWKTSYIDHMTQQEKHIFANVLYCMTAVTLTEWQVRQFATPIAQLNQAIRAKVDSYQNPSEDITMLRTLLERLSYVISARTIYAQTLSTAIEYYNKNTSPILESAFSMLQVGAQEKLRDWAKEQSDNTAQLLKKSAADINDTVQHIQGVSRLHGGMAEGRTPVEIPEGQEENNALVILSIILKNNPELFAVTDTIINKLNETSDHAATVVQAGLDIYKSYYAIIYAAITAPSHSKQYATTLFSMYDILPDEYKTALPDVDHIFEHILQTTKLYTQTEVSPL